MKTGEVYSNTNGAYRVTGFNNDDNTVKIIWLDNDERGTVEKYTVYQSKKRGKDIEIGASRSNKNGEKMTIENFDDTYVTVSYESGAKYMLTYWQYYKGTIASNGEFIDMRNKRNTRLSVLRTNDNGTVDMLDTKTEIVAVGVQRNITLKDFMNYTVISLSLYNKYIVNAEKVGDTSEATTNTDGVDSKNTSKMEIKSSSRGALNPELTALDSKRMNKFKTNVEGLMMVCIAMEGAAYCTVYLPEINMVKERVLVSRFNDCSVLFHTTGLKFVYDADEYFEERNKLAYKVSDHPISVVESYETKTARVNKDGALMLCVSYDAVTEKCDVHFPEYNSVVCDVSIHAFSRGQITLGNRNTIRAEDYGIYEDNSRAALGWRAEHKGRLGLAKRGFNNMMLKIVEYYSPVDMVVQYTNGMTIRGVDYYYYVYSIISPTDTFKGIQGLNKTTELDDPRLLLDSPTRCSLRRAGICTVGDIVDCKISNLNISVQLKARLSLLQEIFNCKGYMWG